MARSRSHLSTPRPEPRGREDRTDDFTLDAYSSEVTVARTNVDQCGGRVTLICRLVVIMARGWDHDTLRIDRAANTKHPWRDASKVPHFAACGRPHTVCMGRSGSVVRVLGRVGGSCQRPSSGPHWRPTRKSRSSGDVQGVLRRVPRFARACFMRWECPSVTTVWQWCRSRSSMLTAVVCSGRNRSRDLGTPAQPLRISNTSYTRKAGQKQCRLLSPAVVRRSDVCGALCHGGQDVPLKIILGFSSSIFRARAHWRNGVAPQRRVKKYSRPIVNRIREWQRKTLRSRMGHDSLIICRSVSSPEPSPGIWSMKCSPKPGRRKSGPGYCRRTSLSIS